MSKEIDLGTLHGIKLPAEMEWRSNEYLDKWDPRTVIYVRGAKAYHITEHGAIVGSEHGYYRPIKEKVKIPWTRDDYIKAGHPPLLRKDTGNSAIPMCYGSVNVVWESDNFLSYETIAKDYTLLSGAELYKVKDKEEGWG